MIWDLAPNYFQRDPLRWKNDALKNPVIHERIRRAISSKDKSIYSNLGAYYSEYDHNKPYKKKGKTSLKNC